MSTPTTTELKFGHLKPGDTVIVCGSYNRKYIRKVARVTPQFIFLEGESGRYRKSDGWGPRTSQWHIDRIELPTPEKVEKIRRHEMINRLASLRIGQLDALPTSTLQEMIAILDGAGKQGE